MRCRSACSTPRKVRYRTCPTSAPSRESVLGWSFSPKGYAGTARSPIPSELEVPLPDYGETLRPDFAVRELEPKDGASPWQLLVRVLEPGEDFDRVSRGTAASSRPRLTAAWSGCCARPACPRVFSSTAARCASSPRRAARAQAGSTSASRTWCRPRAGRSRPRCACCSASRGSSACRARNASLPSSRTAASSRTRSARRLAEQVLHALYELLRGFQAAHDASKGELLREPLAEHPDEVYRALLTVILRLVFLLYAEERDMLPEDETFLRYYSLAGLYERLREDAALFPDTMDQRYGAWAQLLVLFRMIHDGARVGRDATAQASRRALRPRPLHVPRRSPIRRRATQIHERIEPPLVPDGTIYRALEKLLVLDGERISYRALDVEQIGSVYETMMGFRLETATGRSVAIKAQKKQGAPTAVDLEALLARACRQAREVASGPRRPQAHRHGQERRGSRPRRSRTCTQRSCR